MDLLTNSYLDKLNDKVKPIIWVIRIRYGGSKRETYVTGFLVDCDGLLMTCAPRIPFTNTIEIKVRRLDKKGFNMDAKIVYTLSEWGIALLKIEPSSICGKLW